MSSAVGPTPECTMVSG